MLKPLDDIDRTIDLIATVSNSPTHDVRERLRAEVREIGTYSYNCLKSRGIPLYQTSEKLDELWHDSDAFLYEITVWNTGDAKHRMRTFVSTQLNRLGLAGADVFCFGDGLGFDSSWLAMQGHRVRYYEPSLRGQQYAREVFKANGVEVDQLDRLEDIPPNSLDAVVCLDVLEHVPQPQNLVQAFHKWLKPTGVLFVHAPFWCLHWTRPTHLKENRHLSGDLKKLYHRQGFSELDALFFWDPILLQKTDNPSAYARTFRAAARIRMTQFLLTIGRWNSTLYTFIARLVARAPRSWRKALNV